MPRARGVPPSENPRQIRHRMRKKTGRLQEDVDMYLRVTGKPVDEWDMEELARGKPRNAAGNFSGRNPPWLSVTVQQEARRRLMSHAFGSLAGELDQAIKVVHDILTSTAVDDDGRPVVDAKTKLQAAMWIYDHVLGKPKAHVELEGDSVVKQALASALVLDDGAPAHPVIDGQFRDDEEDDDDTE